MYMHNNDIYKYMRYKSYNDVYIYICKDASVHRSCILLFVSGFALVAGMARPHPPPIIIHIYKCMLEHTHIHVRIYTDCEGSVYKE